MRHGPLLIALVLLASPDPATAQLTDLQIGRNFSSADAFGTGRSGKMETGDADNDGDIDVVVPNGTEYQPSANKIFINQGGLQVGVLGAFLDESAVRFSGFPNDTTRDAEFVDIDADGDLDIHVSNKGSPINGGEPNRFYINQGGQQAGTIGHYLEGTDAAYGALVSVAPGDQVLGGNVGPFRDYSCDCDFGDLDDDGDLDLMHSSYGLNKNGIKDTLVFLNDGAGVFDELFPWANAGADIKTHAINIDLADFDGDYDLDVIVASRDSQSRLYLNNLYGPISGTPFHDITQSAILDTGSGQTGSSTYNVEFGDVDGDGDFDLFLQNYSGFVDRVLRNDGSVIPGDLTFTRMNAWLKGDPNSDEDATDFTDYDNDGDIDAMVANFSGTNWLYQSGISQGLDPDVDGLFHRTGTTAGGSLAADPELPASGNGSTSIDAATADVDGDGDEDVLIANDLNAQNKLFTNVLGVPDTHAPAFHQVTVQADKASGTDTVIHAQVRDNSGYYVVEMYTVELIYAVNGGTPHVVPMAVQGGMQFRGVIPDCPGEIAYHVEATDLTGNTGVSSTTSYVQGGGSAWADLGFALAGVSGAPALVGTGTLVAGSPGTLTLSNAAPTALSNLFVSLASTPTPFKGGTLVPVPITITLALFTDAAGTIPLSWAAWPGGLPPGTSLTLQYAIDDAAAVQGVSLSNALKAVTP